MLEIFLVWRLANYIGNEATRKGLKKGRYQLMAVLLWIISEFTGAILGGAIFSSSDSIWPSYGIAILGAVFGAGIAFGVIRLLPNAAPEENQSMSVIEAEPVVSQKFVMSGWVPFLIVLLAVFCMCFILFAAVVMQT